MVYIQKNLNYSFYELCEILNNISIEYRKKLPNKLLELIYENKIDNGFKYCKDKTLDQQQMLHETEILISLLYRNYWCDEKTKQSLSEDDAYLIDKYEGKIQEKYNPNEIFKNRTRPITNNNTTESKEEISLKKFEENKWYQKIFDIIKKLFKKT